MKKLNIFFTFDYEIYFGEKTGSVEKCLIEPTNQLINIAKLYNVNFTFFIDIGYIVKLNQYPELKNDKVKILGQIHELVLSGHDCQLHIHPHWETSMYKNNEWKIDLEKYKLSDFSDQQINEIIDQYSKALFDITGQKVHSYRAGGWCAQPFQRIGNLLFEKGISIDSSAFKNGFNTSDFYYYDYRNCPGKTRWRFDDDICKELINGRFLELPITDINVSRFLFWKLFILGRIYPDVHKSIGDGTPAGAKSNKLKLLTRGSNHYVSSDGYLISLMPEAIKRVQYKKEGNDLVVLGHPKACTHYSLQYLKSFISKNLNLHHFKKFSDVIKHETN